MDLRKHTLKVYGFVGTGKDNDWYMFCGDKDNFYIAEVTPDKAPDVVETVDVKEEPYFIESYGKYNPHVWLTSEAERLKKNWGWEDLKRIYDKWDEQYWNGEGAPAD